MLLQLDLWLIRRLHRLLRTRLIQIHLQVIQGKRLADILCPLRRQVGFQVIAVALPRGAHLPLPRVHVEVVALESSFHHPAVLA